MSDYDLDKLGWYEFERLIQAILKANLGIAVESWGGRADWGCDAYFKEELKFPGEDIQEGPFLFQCKFVENANAAGAKPGPLVFKAVDHEVKRIAERLDRDHSEQTSQDEFWSLPPKVYTFITNAPLTSDQRLSVRKRIRKVLPHSEIVTWGQKDVCDLIKISEAVRDSFPQIWGLQDFKSLLHRVETAYGERDRRQSKERLEYLIRQSKARCLNRFLATGLSEDIAEELAENTTIGKVAFDLPDPSSAPLLLVTGDIGSGKTLFLERLYQESLAGFIGQAKHAIPVFVSWKRLGSQELSEFVSQQANLLGNPNENGVSLFIDGADEGGMKNYAQLLGDSIVLSRSIPGSQVIVTARSKPRSLRDVPTIPIPSLSPDESLRLVQIAIGSNQQPPFMDKLSQSIKDSMKRPLFALLLGFYLKEQHGRFPRSQVDLVSTLIKGSLEQELDLNPIVIQMLGDLAYESTNAGGSAVRSEEIVSWKNENRLLDSRLLVHEGDYFSFSLPLFREWFAAQWLLQEENPFHNVVKDLDLLERWKSPFIIAIGTCSHADASRLLSPIVKRSPGFASVIVRDSIESPWRVEDVSIPEPDECGRRVLETMNAWVSSIRTTAGVIFPLREDEQLPPLGVYVGIGGLTTAWYQGHDCSNSLMVSKEPFDLNPRIGPRQWSPFKMGIPSPSSSWAWEWTHDELKLGLMDMLKKRELPMWGTMVEKELYWEAGREFLKRGPLVFEPLPLEDLLGILADHTGWIRFHGRILEIDRFRRFCENEFAKGRKELESPFPVPDLDLKSGYYWSHYSPERLLARTRTIYQAAIEGYDSLVSNWFPELAPRMTVWVTLPAKVTGILRLPKKVGHAERRPWLSWYLDPLREGERTFLDFSIGDDEPFRYEQMNAVFQKLQKYRHGSREWISFSGRGQALDIYHGFSACELAYDLLTNDLKELGWVD